MFVSSVSAGEQESILKRGMRHALNMDLKKQFRDAWSELRELFWYKNILTNKADSAAIGETDQHQGFDDDSKTNTT